MKIKDTNLVKEKLEEYERRIRRLKQLEIELQSLDIKSFDLEVSLIKRKLKDPKRVEEIEKELSILRKRIKEKIISLISETGKIIEKAKYNAINAKNSFWLSALEIFRMDFVNFAQKFESDRIPLKDAIAHTLRLKEEAETLSIPPAEEEVPKEEIVKENYYDILGVSPKSSQEEIKKAYRKKILECHPDGILRWATDMDKVPEWVKRKADEMTKKLNEAGQVLSDSNKRREYDKKIGVT